MNNTNFFVLDSVSALGVLMEKIEKTNKITIRTAPNFGYQLANNLGIRLENENVSPSQWPVKFPITAKQIADLPELNKNLKVARKVVEAANAMWKDMRESAVEIEKDMRLHPEFYEMLDESLGHRHTHEEYNWRELSIELEQIAGNVFVVDFESEEAAKTGIYKMFGAPSLKKYIVAFEDDYANFINEVREAVRIKKGILASAKLELICLLNTNTKSARKALAKQAKAA